MSIKKLILEEFGEGGKNILPPHLLKGGNTHEHSLGRHPAFPMDDELTFETKLLIKRANELHNIFNTDIVDIKTNLSHLLLKCRKIEKPIRQRLEQICIEFLVDVFGISTKDGWDFRVSLGDKINSKSDLPLEPSPYEYTFKNVAEIDSAEGEIYKRRLLLAINTGAASRIYEVFKRYIGGVLSLNDKLISLYDEVINSNNAILFFDKIKHDYPNTQGAISERYLTPNEINVSVEGIIFPALLLESIESILGVYADKVLPENQELSTYIKSKSDFLNATPWDSRLGVGLWDILSEVVAEDWLTIPVYVKLMELPTNNFFSVMKEIFAKTQDGVDVVEKLKKEILSEITMRDLESRLDSKREKFIIQDAEEYFTEGDLY